MRSTLPLTLLRLAAYTYSMPHIAAADLAALLFVGSMLVRGT